MCRYLHSETPYILEKLQNDFLILTLMYTSRMNTACDRQLLTCKKKTNQSEKKPFY